MSFESQYVIFLSTYSLSRTI